MMLKQNLSNAEAARVPLPPKTQHKQPNKNQPTLSKSANGQIAELSLAELAGGRSPLGMLIE